MGNCQCLDGLRASLQGPQRPVPNTPKQGFKVCIVGGAGSLGQPLCMLAALDPLVWELAVYDRTITLVPAEAIGCDLDHIERKCRVKAYSLPSIEKEVDHLDECLSGCHLVLACVGIPIQGKSKTDLVKYNGSMVKSIVEACAKFCPEAIVGLIVNPVNAVVPAMAALYEKAGLDPRKICGITTLDVVRANKFVHEETGVPIERVSVPVVGGHAGHFTGASALPLLSQDPAGARLSQERRAEVIKRVQEGNEEVWEAKKGKAATLSQAYAGWRFGHAVLSGLAGTRTEEFCFLKSNACEGVDYFASKVTFGPMGAEKIHPVGTVSADEQKRLDEVKSMLIEDIKCGLDYAESTELSKGSASPVHSKASGSPVHS